MATVVNDLVTKFSFSGSTKPLMDYNKGLDGSIKLLGGFVLGVNAAAGAFAYWADGILSGVDSLSQLSNETDVAIGKIQELNFIAGQTQAGPEAVATTLRGLSQTIGDAAQKGSEEFSRLGISVRDASGHVKSADVILDDVRHRFQQLGLSMSEQQSFAQALGIDPSMLQMLGKTDQQMGELRDRARELGTLTNEQAEQAEQYKKSLNSMWFSLNSVKQLIAVGVAPQLTSMAESFEQLLADNRDWIVNGVQFAAKWLDIIAETINRLLPVIAGIVVAFAVWKVATIGLGAVLGVVFSPVVLITAAIVALLAIVDDLIVAFNGGESVIADFFKDTFDIDIVKVMTVVFKTMGQAVDVVVDGFKQLWQYWLRIIQAIKSGGSSVAKFFGLNFGDEVPEDGPEFTEQRLNDGDEVPDDGPEFIEQRLNDGPEFIEQRLNDGPEFTEQQLNDGPEFTEQQLNDGPEFTEQRVNDDPEFIEQRLDNIPIAAGTIQGGNVTNNQVSQQVDISITTNDPEAAGRAVGDTLQRQLDNANTQLDVGGR